MNWITLLVAGLLATGVASLPAQSVDSALVARARAIHARVITLDTHVDINPGQFTDKHPNYTDRLASQVNLPKMQEGGMDAVFFSIFVGQGPLTDEGYARAHAADMEKFAAVHRLAEQLAPEQIEIAYTAADVPRIAAAGKKIALMGVENGYGIGTDLMNVTKFHGLGARYLSLAHNGHSQLSDSNTGERDGVWMWNGLSPLGRQVVTEMNRLGIMIDISHPSKASMLQTVALTQAPIIASHSAVRALCDVSRNLDDEQLKALAKNGGVVQIVAFSAYLKKQPGGRATVRDLVDHIDYAVKLIGLDHVGISSDFDGGGGVDGFNDATEAPNVTIELVRRGYTEAQIGQLWSGNLLRVLREVEQVAERLRR